VSRAARTRRAGFTLAEVAVTIVIVGIGLVLVLQGLNTAKITAAQTRNLKLARELGLFTLGQIESGLPRDEIESGMQGSYAEEGYPDFTWEVALGEDALPDRGGQAAATDKPFDSWAPRDETTSSRSSSSQSDAAKKSDEEEDSEEPYEKVKLRVTFPKIREFQNELVLERWMPWKQVYGEAETADGRNESKNPKAAKAASASKSGGAAGAAAAQGKGSTGATTPTGSGAAKAGSGKP
jgi:prepilin-type N-terminal cleavage/methylation domain-containing protein